MSRERCILRPIVLHLVPEPDPCPLCGRPNFHPSDHHLVPKSRGGKVTKTICRDCHKAVHSLFTNKQLEKTYNTVEALLGHEEFRKMVGFLRKQDPQSKQTFVRSNASRRRGRAG